MSSEIEYKTRITEDIKLVLGTNWWTIIQLLYLTGKYQNSCVFLPITIEAKTHEKYINKSYIGQTTLTWSCRDKGCKLVPPMELLETYGDKSFGMYREFLTDCVNLSERLSVIPISLANSEHKARHSNILIYDKKENTLERYEPRGQHTTEFFHPKGLDEKLKEFFGNIFPDVTYYSPEEYCPIVGPQIMEEMSREALGIELRIGFCVIWSFIYANFRLQHPDFSRNSIAKYVSENLKKKQNLYIMCENVIIMISELGEKIRKSENLEEIQESILLYINKKII